MLLLLLLVRGRRVWLRLARVVRVVRAVRSSGSGWDVLAVLAGLGSDELGLLVERERGDVLCVVEGVDPDRAGPALVLRVDVERVPGAVCAGESAKHSKPSSSVVVAATHAASYSLLHPSGSGLSSAAMLILSSSVMWSCPSSLFV